MDKYGLGAGVYPKDKAPVPPFHPFCRCQMVPKYSHEYAKPKLNADADKEYLLGLKEWQRARILGSKAKANEALKTGDINSVFNAMKPERYKVKSINEVAKFEKNTNIKAGNNVNNKAQNQQENYQPSEKIKGLIDKFKQKMVTYLEPQKLKSPLSEDEIIKKISGGDLTQGSCASVALAYLANKAGLDVRDFRGGASREIIAHGCRSILINSGAKIYYDSSTADAQKTFTKVAEVLRSGKSKEVYLAYASHATIIRYVPNRSGGVFDYLELQSEKKNGWVQINSLEQIEHRFGAKIKQEVISDKTKIKKEIKGAIIADADNLANNKDIRAIIGYLNTKDGDELKGEKGNIK
ncbi:MAG: hypothetical protein SPJ69_00195 [Campylobacter sp.]|uniref:hypothetical protein n=1 Tax=Campylobacter sp. TaxID=205 RepID=UPI0029727717|nr:hypothetical protein [Campylobacter sp.]MDD7599390.1 hypothetical protein [Campylobacteraceae bacterium]MDY5886723.1 hypothetical protein [Campylobacter sp.]